jgi:hypothetical protein
MHRCPPELSSASLAGAVVLHWKSLLFVTATLLLERGVQGAIKMCASLSEIQPDFHPQAATLSPGGTVLITVFSLTWVCRCCTLIISVLTYCHLNYAA